MKKSIVIVVAALALASFDVAAQGAFGPKKGDQEFSLAGTGASDKDFDNSSFGISADLGWWMEDNIVWGLRQSVNYADVQGADVSDDFWNGSTRGYLNYHLGTEKARPFVGGSFGAIYGDGVNDSAMAGLEFGLKYYVLEKTYILARAEYQFFLGGDGDSSDQFDDGAFAYTLGMGFNF